MDKDHLPLVKKVPRRYQPPGFEILYEDRDIIVGNKARGFLTVKALWNKDQTIHAALNTYVRKGSVHSRKCVYVVHRLDQDTSGVLVFAKTEQAMDFLKAHWRETVKIYYAVVRGRPEAQAGTISNYLYEDEEYRVHATEDKRKGRLAQTMYTVVKATDTYSLLKVELLTGRKNQIRVHLAGIGLPIVGDAKYGPSGLPAQPLALHARSLTLTHPFSKERMTFTAEVPSGFYARVGTWHEITQLLKAGGLPAEGQVSA